MAPPAIAKQYKSEQEPRRAGQQAVAVGGSPWQWAPGRVLQAAVGSGQQLRSRRETEVPAIGNVASSSQVVQGIVICTQRKTGQTSCGMGEGARSSQAQEAW